MLYECSFKYVILKIVLKRKFEKEKKKKNYYSQKKIKKWKKKKIMKKKKYQQKHLTSRINIDVTKNTDKHLCILTTF